MKNLRAYVSAAALAVSLAAVAMPANAVTFVDIATSGLTGSNQVVWKATGPGTGVFTVTKVKTVLNFNDDIFDDGALGNVALLTLTATATTPSLLTLGPVFFQGGLNGSFDFVLKSNPSLVLLHGDFTNFWISGAKNGIAGNLTSGGPGATLNLTSQVADLSAIYEDNASFSFTNASPKFGITGTGANAKLNSFKGANLTGTFGGVVPEPASWALMIMGFGGVGAMVRRRKASAALA